MREELKQAVPQMEGQLTEPVEYRPSNTEALRGHEIRIRFLSRGCVISVGCKEIAFESVEKAMEELNNYVANPWEQQQTWRKILD